MKAHNIDIAVAHGILKTINRFRDNPFLYLTASDIHASLLNDIVDGGGSDLFNFKVYDALLRLIPDKVLNVFIDVKIDANGLIENTIPSFYYNDDKRKLPYWVGLLTKGFEGYQ